MRSHRNPPTANGSVLLDFLDDSGDRVEDAQERQRVLTAAGFPARTLAVMESDDAGGDPVSAPRDFLLVMPDRWERELRQAAEDPSGATLWLCGGGPGHRARTAASLWPGPVAYWPTRLTGDESEDRRTLDLAVAARVRTVRTRTPLWDGPYLLAPAPIAGPQGEALLEAFVDVADEHDMLDLVVLGRLPDDLQHRAHELGVALRVHGAGHAPLRAECAWLAGAAAVLVGAGPLPGMATLLRALEGPAPVVVTGNDRAARSVHGWLAGRGACMAPPCADSEQISAALRDALSRGSSVREAVARGAALSAEYRGERAAAYLKRDLAGQDRFGEAAA